VYLQNWLEAMNKIAVSAVIFPANYQFFSAFCESLERQTEKKFTVFLFNDGCSETELSGFRKFGALDIRFVAVSGSIVNIRNQRFQFLKNLNADFHILLDSDDYVSDNYIEQAVALLHNFPIVASDVCFFNGTEQIMGFWSSRIDHSLRIDAAFISDKNCLGLGNTSIRSEVLADVPQIPEGVIAVDWFVFSVLIQKHSAVISTAHQLWYRTHESNQIGIGQLTEKKLRTILDVKSRHYKLFNAVEKVRHEIALVEQLEQTGGVRGFLDFVNNNNIPFFWWEETLQIHNYYAEKNSAD
jgi:glycosyltransferase involved in cell wall biosynthesis